MSVRRLRVVVEADGGARGNPGPAGYGAVVREANTGEVLAERSEFLGVATNNVAEYSGLIAGLQAAAELGAVEVEIRMDSKLVVEQMSGRWQIKNPGLRPLAAKAAALVRRFDSVKFSWIPREQNKHADALANAAMDAGARQTSTGRAVPSNPALLVDSSAWQRAVAEPAATAASDATVTSGAPTAPRSWEPPAGAATRLILVRHGETALTADRRYSGRGDVELSEVGLAQARAAADRIAGLVAGSGVAAVVSSPLSRCLRTAELIAAAAGTAQLPVVVEPDLVETDFGDWEGKTFAEVRAQWPAEMDAWLASTSIAPPGGESLQAVGVRVRRVVATLLDSYPESVVVVVSHVSPLKLMLRDALAASDAFLYRLYLDPTGISIVDSWRDGGVAVRTVNDTAHLAGLS